MVTVVIRHPVDWYANELRSQFATYSRCDETLTLTFFHWFFETSKTSSWIQLIIKLIIYLLAEISRCGAHADVLMYETMTTYMLPESPESSSHAPSNQVSNSASLIGSPRSTPVFGNGHTGKQPNGCASKDVSPLWNGNHPTTLLFQQQQQQQMDDENQSVRSDNSMSLRTRKSSSKSHGRNTSHRSHK